MKTIQYLLLAWLLMPHFCAAYEASEQDFVVIEKVAALKTESLLPAGNKLRTWNASLFMRMLGTKWMQLHFLGAGLEQRREVAVATIVHAYKPLDSSFIVYKPVAIECVRNL